MTTSPPYRHFIAALLLLLYVFIATPVHWWHHHKQGNPHTLIADTGSDDTTALTQDSGASYASHCNICSHGYSVYTTTEEYRHTNPAPSYGLCQAGYIEHALTIPVLLFSNKGPPTLLS